jgi:hypothetical protein
MEPKFQTSFIPKRPIGSGQGSGIGVIRSTNIFSVIATVVFIVAVLTSGGLFFYKSILTKQIAEADKSIVDARVAFETEKIKELVDANARITSAKNLLGKHVVVSKVLVLMEDLVLKKMRFTDFSFVNKDNQPTVSVSGEIQTYNALAEQQDVFSKNPFVENAMFSNFNLADNGYIMVKFTADINSDLVSYKKAVESSL